MVTPLHTARWAEIEAAETGSSQPSHRTIRFGQVAWCDRTVMTLQCGQGSVVGLLIAVAFGHTDRRRPVGDDAVIRAGVPELLLVCGAPPAGEEKRTRGEPLAGCTEDAGAPRIECWRVMRSLERGVDGAGGDDDKPARLLLGEHTVNARGERRLRPPGLRRCCIAMVQCACVVAREEAPD
jgi:hypothetical protein